jgi:hypothetical protein
MFFLIFSDAGTDYLLFSFEFLNAFLFIMVTSDFYITYYIYSSHFIIIRKISGLLQLKSNVYNYYSENNGILSLNFLPIKNLLFASFFTSPPVNMYFIFS